MKALKILSIMLLTLTILVSCNLEKTPTNSETNKGKKV